MNKSIAVVLALTKATVKTKSCGTSSAKQVMRSRITDCYQVKTFGCNVAKKSSVDIATRLVGHGH